MNSCYNSQCLKIELKSFIPIPRAKKALKRLNIDIKTDEIQRFLRGKKHKKVEDDVSVIDEGAFVRLARSKKMQMETAEAAFRLFDKDQKGVVVLEDLQRVAKAMNELD